MAEYGRKKYVTEPGENLSSADASGINARRERDEKKVRKGEISL